MISSYLICILLYFFYGIVILVIQFLLMCFLIYFYFSTYLFFFLYIESQPWKPHFDLIQCIKIGKSNIRALQRKSMPHKTMRGDHPLPRNLDSVHVLRVTCRDWQIAMSMPMHLELKDWLWVSCVITSESIRIVASKRFMFWRIWITLKIVVTPWSP